MNGPITETANFVQVATLTVSYSIQGGGSPSAPVFNYTQAGVSKTYKLTLTRTSIQVDVGSSWYVAPNPLSGSSGTQRWQADPATLSGTASASTTLVFTFYHQYQLKLSYAVMGGGSGYTAPTFTANQYGVPASQMLSTSATPFWFDAGSAWSVPNPLSGSSSTEGWFTAQKTGGTLTGSATYAFSYQHQYYLTMQTNPSGAGSATPGSGWQNAGSKVSIKATAKTGYKFLNWTGSGAGSYNGTKNPATITMNAPITETGNFEVLITITSTPTGSGYVFVDSKAVKTPETFSWVVGSTHNITAVTAASCGTGCQYVFTVWSDGGARSHTITTPGSPTTYKATFQKQYMLTMKVNPSGGGTVSPTGGWYNAGQKITLTATPSDGYTFKSWKGTGTGSYTGSNPSPTITVNSAITETANFTSSMPPPYGFPVYAP
jgi:hypothetical protein